MNTDPKKLLELYKPKEVKVLKPDRQMCMVRFSACGKVLAAGCQDGTIRRWDASSDQLADLPPLTGHGGWVQAIAFAPQPSAAPLLYAADSWGQLRAWSLADSKSVWTNDKAHDGWIHGLACSADGQLLATCGIDKIVRAWSTVDGKKVHEFAGHNEDVFAVAFHPDGKSLVSGDHKGVVKHWDLATGKPVRAFDCKIMYKLDRLQDVGGVRCLAFERDGKTLACGGLEPKNGGNVQGVPTILVFDWQTAKLKHTLKNGVDGDGYVYDMHFHPEGFVMAVTSGNPGVGKFFFQRPEAAQPFFLTSIPNCHSLGVHPNGQRLVVSATNGGSNGNGRKIGKSSDYPGNWSPLHVLDMPKLAAVP